MRKIITRLSAIVLLLSSASLIKAQALAGSYTIGVSYPDIASAISALNTNSISASTTIEIPAGYTETAPVGGYTLICSGTAGAPIVFRKNGVGSNPLITAYTGGTGTPGTAFQDGVWRLVGTDYITIDGIDITDPNAANPATMEFGYGLFKASATDGCQYNTIKNCVITLNRINNAGGISPATDGSRGIDVVNALSTAHNAVVTVTSANGTNSFNMFYSNVIQNCNIGIALIGYAASTPFTNADQFNDVGGLSAVTGNTIINYGGGGTTSPAAAIRTLAQYNINVSYNTINNNNGSGVNHGTTLRGIYINTATSSNVTATNNTITVRSGAASSQLAAIENVAGSTAASNTVNISNNVITNCSYSSATSGAFYGIYNNGATPAVLIISNNIVNNNTLAGTGTFTGIDGGGGSTTISASMSSNTVTGNSKTGANGTFYCMRIGTASVTVNGNIINNNSISNTSGTSSSSLYGIYNISGPMYEVYTNNSIDNLSIGGASTATGHLIYGMYSNTSSSSVKTYSNNIIHSLMTTPAMAGGTVYGVYHALTGTTDIYKNKIYNLTSNGASGLCFGMYISSGNAVNISNNLIGDLKTPSANAGHALAGIYINGGSSHTIFYNTVYLNATSSGALFGSSAFYTSTTPTVSVRNNILINNSSPAGTGLTAVYRRSGTSLTTYSTVSDNNILYGNNSSANCVLFSDGTNTYSTLAVYQAAVAPREANSFTENTTFLSIVGSSPSFLHVDPSITTASESGAVNIAGITNDYDADIRQGNPGYSGTGTAPDIGADEFNGIAITTDISALDIASPVLSPACYGLNQTVSVVIKNTGAAPIDFALNNTTVTASASGPNPQTFPNVVITSGTLAVGATQTVVITSSYNMTAAGTYSFNASATAAGDGNAANDAMPVATRIVMGTATLPQTVDFTGFTGANLTTVFPNWYEATGATVPAGTTSTFTYQTGLNTAGNITARVNLFGNTKNEWIVGPKFTAASNSKLTFDAAVTDWGSTTTADVMGSDDNVRVMISTNCGASYTPVFTISVTNSLTTTLTNFSIPLSAYAGQDIIVGFLASEGTVNDAEDYDFHLDNINIINVAPQDAGISALTSPATTGCYGSAENLVVTINNLGGSPITNIPVTVIVSGAATQTSNAVYTGTIAPSSSVSFTVATLNMTAYGTYSFSAFTSLAGDANAANDNMTPVIRVNAAPVSLPQTVDFTGFTGANLTTVFPNWNEASGATVPVGTTSTFTYQTGLNTAGNITARVNLFGNTKNEWIVGPKFTAASNSKLTFDAAVTDWNSITASDAMGSDDNVRVMISTDCGASYTPVFTISATNSLTPTFTNISVPLSAYAGQDIIVGFLASEGTVNDAEDYDFHLDNINILNVPAQDAGATALTSPATTGCYGSAENLVVTIYNYGALPMTNVPVTVIVSGAATQTSNAVYTGTVAPSASASFTVGTLNMTTAGTYSFNAFTSLPGDGNSANDNMAVTTRTVIAPVSLPQTVDFTGYTGTNLTTVFPNWYEAAGATFPSGTTSTFTYQTGLNGVGNITAKVNLFSNTKNEWIVGPKFIAASNSQLTFDAAVTDWNSITASDAMGSDDMVRVMLSTDCGTSYVPVYTISATNSLSTTFTNFSIPLAVYAGQEVIVAFQASEGTVNDAEDYDFHLDNINILNVPAQDAGATALTSPATTGCYGSSENLVVTIKNFGSAPITNVPVTVIVSGAATQTSNAVYSGTIAPSASASLTVGTLNMTAYGTYSFNAYTSLAGDGNSANDNMTVATRTNVAPVSLPQTVDFTGFTGANLTTVFPNWYEATGATIPVGTTSTFTYQTGLNAVGNITARVNLFGNSKNEWIVGPKLTASANSQLTFDAAVTDWTSITASDVMGSDDNVRVMISTDCGMSYAPVFTINATNSLTPAFTKFTIPLSVYSGQDIIVAFLASEGTVNDAEDYDFHLDNINLCNMPSAPVSAGSVICTGTTASISTSVTGTPYWYNAAVGGSVISTSSVYTTPTLTANATYYLADSTACGISPRTAITVTVNPNPILSAVSSISVLCTGNSATLTAGGANTYSWTGIGSGASIVISPTITTTYTVEGVDSNGCMDTLSVTQVVSACTGVQNILASSNGILIYPNPSSGMIHLVVTDISKPVKLEIYDAVGKQILSKEIDSQLTEISIIELMDGIYSYRVMSNSQIVKQGKLVKE